MIDDTLHITVESLTGGATKESGLFEELMRSVKSHLSEEYSAGRITGEAFTQVYLGAMQSALMEASRYTLTYQITNQQVRLLDAQIQAADKDAELKQAQIDQVNAQTAQIVRQTALIDKQEDILDSQILTAAKQLLLIDTQITNGNKDLETKTSAIALQSKQGNLVDAQVQQAIAQELNTIATTNKANAEKEILVQRKISEEAQTKDTVGGVAVAGILGKQMQLYHNQAEGFIRDSEQKAAKIYSDAFLTRVSTDYDNASATNAGLSDADALAVLTKLRAGVGV